MDFPNQFSEKIDILDTIPKEEYENLGFKSVFILRELLKDREFHNEGNIEERMKKYEDHSDPLEKFLNEFTDTNDPNKHIFKWEFEKRLNGWLVEHRFRGMSDRTISKKMKEKGVVDDRVTAEWYDNYEKIRKQVRAWVGIQWKS